MKHNQLQQLNNFVSSIPNEQRDVFLMWYKLVESTLLPIGYSLDFTYKMPTFSVPLSVYSKGYLNNPLVPLPYVSIAAQKNHIAIYHYGIYADQDRYNQFLIEYEQTVGKPADIGKSCIRLKYNHDIPQSLLKKIVAAYSPESFVRLYESVKHK